jgi:hypothetical protein
MSEDESRHSRLGQKRHSNGDRGCMLKLLYLTFFTLRSVRCVLDDSGERREGN